MDDGLSEETVGAVTTGAVIVNVRAFEGVPVPFTTVTWAVPCVVNRVAGTCAVSAVELPNVVVRLVVWPLRLHCTTELLVKPVPLTLRLTFEESAVADEGFNKVSVGVVTTAVMVNGKAKSWVPFRDTLTCQLPGSLTGCCPAIAKGDAAHPEPLVFEVQVGWFASTVPDGWIQLYVRTSPIPMPLKLSHT